MPTTRLAICLLAVATASIADAPWCVDARAQTTVSFRAPSSIGSAALNIEDSFAAELTGDGLPDLLVRGQTSRHGETFGLARGVGGGDFLGVELLAARPAPGTQPVFGDVDSDGDIDICTVVQVGQSFSFAWLRNDGRGGFEAAIGAQDSGLASSLQLSDADTDGDLDLFFITDQGTVASLSVDSAGLSNTVVDTGVTAARFLVDDFDGDGRADLVTVGATIEIRRGGAAGFGPPATVGGPVPALIDGVFVSDLNQDGNLDIAVSTRTAGAAQVLTGDGMLGFSPTVFVSSDPAALRSFALADFNGDGLDDLFYVELFDFPNPANPRLALGTGTLPFDLGELATLTPSTEGHDQYVDATGDGKADVLTRAALYPSVASASGGAFGEPRRLLDSLAYITTAKIGDIDGDGDLDIVALDSLSQTLALQTNEGELRFAPARDLTSLFGPVSSFGLGDMNGDGRSEFFVIRSTGSSDALVAFGDLGAGVAELDATPLSVPPGKAAVFDALDIDGDTRADVVVRTGDELRLYLADASGSLTPGAVLTIVGDEQRFADLDADGDLDFVELDGTQLSIREQSGAGAFLPPLTRTFALPSYDVEVADVDGDGRQDVVLQRNALTQCVLGLGGLTFGPVQVLFDFPANQLIGATRQLDVRDVDGNGLVDFIVTPFDELTARGTHALLQSSPLNVSASVEIVAGTWDFDRHAYADFDGDGDLDVLTRFALGSPHLTISENESVTAIGTTFCRPQVENSAGTRGTINGYGEALAGGPSIRLIATRLPREQFGIFVGSQSAAPPTIAGNSVGIVCIGGSIGRYNAPGDIRFTGTAGSFALDIDPLALVVGNGTVAAVAGESWHFQAWHRDVVSGASTSNFTDALEIRFE